MNRKELAVQDIEGQFEGQFTKEIKAKETKLCGVILGDYVVYKVTNRGDIIQRNGSEPSKVISERHFEQLCNSKAEDMREAIRKWYADKHNKGICSRIDLVFSFYEWLQKSDIKAVSK